MSEDTRAGRDEEIQGEIKGLMSGDAGPGVPPPQDTEDPAGVGPAEGEEPAAAVAEEARASGARDAEAPAGEEVPDAQGDRLSGVLEMLEERVSLLLERHADLLRRHREAEEESREMAGRLARLREEGADPDEFLARIRSLESENDRLSEHAAFLEGRIESLLTRVRYVVES
ncbi:MAG: hypothetical protein KY397_05430 [Gemmatimonadetes bacterium]|nr:hypothetical protein [Gemmatimonadota bacterium]